MNGKPEENAKPKVLVGCPISDYHEYCTEEFIESIKTLTYDNYDILLIDNSKDERFFNSIKDKVPAMRGEYLPNVYDRLIHNRNILRQKFLEGNYDYFFSLEQDVIPPRNVIEILLAYKKDIVSGVYFKTDIYESYRGPVAMLWVMHQTDPNKVVPVKRSIVDGNHFIKIDFCGLGCALIHRCVLEKIRFRYDLANCEAMDDIFLSMDAKKEGFDIYADTALKCKHLIKGREWCWRDLAEKEK